MYVHVSKKQQNDFSAVVENDLVDFKATGWSFMIILALEALLLIKYDYKNELAWISNFA